MTEFFVDSGPLVCSEVRLVEIWLTGLAHDVSAEPTEVPVVLLL